MNGKRGWKWAEGEETGCWRGQDTRDLLALRQTATSLSLKSISGLAFWQHSSYAFSSDSLAILDKARIFKVLKYALNET